MYVIKMRFRKSVKCFIGIIIILYIIYNVYVTVIMDIYTYPPEKQLNLTTKYILVWTRIDKEPMKDLREGRRAFIERGCPYTNCYVTNNRKLLPNITEFHTIIFHIKDMRPKFKRISTLSLSLPKLRKPHQKYIFASMESEKYYPLCDARFYNFFNWTWTYKLKSDLSFNYLSIWDKDGNVIGPKTEMHWMKVEDMLPINNTLKAILSTKSKAAAWFVSNCGAPNKRGRIARRLKEELKNFDLRVDVYGTCGPMQCRKSKMDVCLRKLRRDYYFYLAFENSFAEDYVTEKLLRALNNYAVPIVYGGGNYTRFMPDGIYLEARMSSIKDLVSTMAYLIGNKEAYYEFFKWHNHYSYHSVYDSVETDSYCKLCEAISDEERMNKTTIYENIGAWWSPHLCHG